MGKGSRPKKHPMSAGRREPNGRKQRETTRAAREAAVRDKELVRPTPETLTQLRHNGPTCVIERAMSIKDENGNPLLLTSEEGQALSNYARDRRCYLDVRDVECKPGPLARLAVRDARDSTETLPSTWNTPMSDEERERRASRYIDAYAAIKATGDRRAASQAALVIGGYVWTDADSLKNAARALRAFYVRGVRAA